MTSFLDWITAHRDRPWLVLGQGPSFSRHVEWPDLDARYYTLGLNRVCRARPVFLAHVVDLHVFDEVPGFADRAEWLLTAWRPHLGFSPVAGPLDELVGTNPTLRTYHARGRLLWYNLGTWHGPTRPDCPVVPVKHFATEAVVHLLAMGGVREIRWLGLDGGRAQAEEFKDHPSLRAGHETYSLQDGPIGETARRFELDYKALWL